MPVDTIVKCPERIKNPSDIQDILSRMELYKQEHGCEAVVLLIQQGNLGGIYIIKTVEEAKGYMANKTRIGAGIHQYTRSFFENKLRELG
jgi:hypothetical protein